MKLVGALEGGLSPLLGPPSALQQSLLLPPRPCAGSFESTFSFQCSPLGSGAHPPTLQNTESECGLQL